MSRRRARKRGLSEYRRRQGNKPGRRILVVCEGGKTEPEYFKALKKELKLGAMVVVEGEKCGSAPINVVDWALRKQKRAVRDHEPFDAVWCVFDCDQHQTFFSAIEKARKKKLHVAPSVPSFEIWVLLHFRYTTAPFETCDDVIAAIEPWYPGYDKSNMDWDSLRPNRETARQNAQRILEQDTSEDEHPNPSTRVHELVAFLEDL